VSFALYYPTKADQVIAWEPPEPSIGSKPFGRVGGLLPQRMKSGRKKNWRVHPKLQRFMFLFQAMSATDVAEREAFWDAANGASFELEETEYVGGLVAVTFVGASLNFDPDSTEGDHFTWTEEFEEQPAVTSILDPAILRTGYTDISGASTTGLAVFSSDYPDAAFTPTLGSSTITNTGAAVKADIVEGSLTEGGFTIRIGAPPGAGNTCRVYWHAIRQ
jgi:hypothetical protein